MNPAHRLHKHLLGEIDLTHQLPGHPLEEIDLIHQLPGQLLGIIDPNHQLLPRDVGQTHHQTPGGTGTAHQHLLGPQDHLDHTDHQHFLDRIDVDHLTNDSQTADPPAE